MRYETPFIIFSCESVLVGIINQVQSCNCPNITDEALMHMGKSGFNRLAIRKWTNTNQVTKRRYLCDTYDNLETKNIILVLHCNFRKVCQWPLWYSSLLRKVLSENKLPNLASTIHGDVTRKLFLRSIDLSMPVLHRGTRINVLINHLLYLVSG